MESTLWIILTVKLTSRMIEFNFVSTKFESTFTHTTIQACKIDELIRILIEILQDNLKYFKIITGNETDSMAIHFKMTVPLIMQKNLIKMVVYYLLC